MALRVMPGMRSIGASIYKLLPEYVKIKNQRTTEELIIDHVKIIHNYMHTYFRVKPPLTHTLLSVRLNHSFTRIAM